MMRQTIINLKLYLSSPYMFFIVQSNLENVWFFFLEKIKFVYNSSFISTKL